MDPSITAEKFIEELRKGQQDFKRITIEGKIEIKGVFSGRTQRSKGKINLDGCQLDELIIKDDIDQLSIQGAIIKHLQVEKINILELQDTTVEDALILSSAQIGRLFLSRIKIKNDLFFNDLQAREINCGDNLDLAWLFQLQKQDIVVNYKAVRDFVQVIRSIKQLSTVLQLRED